MNKRQREVYSALMAVPPSSERTGWGGAYFMGFHNPMLPVEQAGPIVGLAGSEARAAFMAGRCKGRQASASVRGTSGSAGRWLTSAARAFASSGTVTWTEARGKDSVAQIGGTTVARITRRPMMISGSITGYHWDVSDQLSEVQFNGSRRFASVRQAKSAIEAVLAATQEGQT